MHLMAAERRCFEDLTATLHDGPAMKEGGAWIKRAKAHTNGWKEETTCENNSLAFYQTALV